MLATNTLDADEAEAYQDQSGGEACGPLIDTAVIANLPDDVTVTALTQDEEPERATSWRASSTRSTATS